MKNQNYKDKLLDPRWQKKRLEVLNRDNFTCLRCGDDKTTLHIHHKSYKGNPWEVSLSELETVCSKCHEKEHKKESDFKYEQEKDEPYIESLKRTIDSDPILIESVYLLNLSYKNTLGYKYVVPASIQWEYKQLLKFEAMTDDDFYNYKKELGYKLDCSLKEWTEFNLKYFNEECIKEGIIVSETNRSFGSTDREIFLIEETNRYYGRS